MRAGRVTTLVICSYVIVSWLRWWIPQMTCGKLFLLQHSLATSLLEQKKNLFWRLPSWVNLLSLFLVKNEDVSVWFNIIWLGMQIEIRVKYQGWWKFYNKKTLPPKWILEILPHLHSNSALCHVTCELGMGWMYCKY